MCHCVCVCGSADADDMGQLDGLTTPEALEAFRALYIKCVTRDTPLAGTELGLLFHMLNAPYACVCVLARVCALACTCTCTHARPHTHPHTHTHTHAHTHTHYSGEHHAQEIHL